MQALKRVALSLSILLALSSRSPAQEGVSWQENLEQAKQVASQTNRLVWIHFWAPWCKPCMRLEREVFSQSPVAAALGANFVAVKLNADEFTDLAKGFSVDSLPTDVVITPAGELVSRFNSPLTAAAYITQANQVAAKTLPAAGGIAQAEGETPKMVANPYTAVPAMNPMTPAAGGPLGPRYQTDPAVAGGESGRSQIALQAAQQQLPSQTADNRYVSAAASEAATLSQRYAEPTAQPPVAGPSMSGPAQAGAAGNSFGLDAYCPVALVEGQQWILGDRRWGAVHRGKTYLFRGEAEQQKFLAAPDRYSPALAGNDPVLAVDGGQLVEGKRQHGVYYQNQVYLFAGEATLARFSQAPDKYLAGVRQAMQNEAGGRIMR